MGNEEPHATSSIAPGAITALLREVFRTPSVDPKRALPPFRPGVVVGRFELLREIGRGGFGVVYEASDRQLRRAVALKAVRMGGDVALKEERLLREAEAAAQLSHPNIVTLYDVGTFERGPYLVMELLRGRTLGDRCASGPISVREALPIAVEIAKGIAHAHANGVIHRDLTAGNVFLCGDGHVKVLDFGMAQAFGRRKLDGGTMAYMAPEQYRGEPEDERTDVFALGVILHQMLAGEVPFRDAAALAGAAAAPPLDLPDAPALAALVARMLEKDAARRPRDGREVLTAVVACHEALSAAASSAPLASGVAGRARPRRVLLLKAFGVLLVLAAAALLALGRTDGHARDEAAPLPAAATAVSGESASGPATPEPATLPSRSLEPARVAAVPEPPQDPLRLEAPPPRVASPRPSAAVRYCRSSLNAVPLPDSGTGDGVLTIDADPFAQVFVNDRPYGETPRECRVAHGSYVVRMVHPLYGTRQARVEVMRGERARWTADFLVDR